MKSRDVLKLIATRKLKASDIPTIAPERRLIQTSPDTFTDEITGDTFTADQVEVMLAPFSRNICEITIVGDRERLLEHKHKVKPYLTPVEINGNDYWQYRTVYLPKITKQNQFSYLKKH